MVTELVKNTKAPQALGGGGGTIRHFDTTGTNFHEKAKGNVVVLFGALCSSIELTVKYTKNTAVVLFGAL